MSLAIVILNWNGKHFLEKFLPLLEKRSRLPGTFIVIADNGSKDDSCSYVKENHPDVRLIEMGDNYGFTGGYNLALSLVEADYYLLLNSDVEVTRGWLDPLVKAMHSNPGMGICMPKIKSAYDTNSFEYAGASGGFIDTLGYPFCRGRILSCLERDEGQYDQQMEIFWASGAAMMIRSSLFWELGGFDDRFFAHMEEIDLCWRAKQRGWQVWVVPESAVYHVGGGTLPNNSPSKLYLNYRNNLFMLYKNLPERSLYLTFIARFFMDSAAAVLFILTLRFSYFWAVIRAYADFLNKKPGIERDSNLVNKKLSGIFRGSIVLSFFLRWGRLRFFDVGADIT
ncbi:MAG: glycosyltransferase family 2 protein [Bacteroidales bacterium]|nr:glycosyltransferase [Bacteroidales bacterium]MDD2425222.1 glycosyltransferase family 2 protein [Bacteroidales bacterium]MDD3989931.1 glycosyltransferase family 2 protein [Bacteroidales bacterium]MDD4638900.1 glycosyltransferase family 2 protein [Bacteroidales bacterium]